MKRLLLAVFLLAGCSSSDGFIDRRGLDCESGQAISVRVGILGTDSRMEYGTESFTLGVEISNNSHEEITVKSITIRQITPEYSILEVDPASHRAEQVIDEDDDHLFELVMRGRIRRELNRTPLRSEVSLLVSVALAGGDSYHCRFVVPVSV